MKDSNICDHINAINELKFAQEQVCEECKKNGTTWIHLRTCQTCGVTLCCDESPNTHMSKHYEQTLHPVIISAQPGEKWMWCFPHKIFVEYD